MRRGRRGAVQVPARRGAAAHDLGARRGGGRGHPRPKREGREDGRDLGLPVVRGLAGDDRRRGTSGRRDRRRSGRSARRDGHRLSGGRAAVLVEKPITRSLVESETALPEGG